MADTAQTTQSYGSIVWTQLKKRRDAQIGMALIGLFFACAFLAPFLCHRLPLVWISDAEGWRFPLFREFFAPNDSTEPILERAFNFLLLFAPIGLVLHRKLPAWSTHARTWIAMFLCSLPGMAVIAVIIYIARAIQPNDTFSLALLYGITGAACLLVMSVALLAGAQFSISPRWLVVLGAGLFLALPFLLTQVRNDPTPYRTLAAEGKGRGLFPLIPYGPKEGGFGTKIAPSWHKGKRVKTERNLAGYHLLGTDESGRDVLVRVIHGGRVSLAVGFLSIGLATFLGIFFGACAGYFRGRVDILISRFMELLMCIPSFFLILTIIAVMDKRSILNIMLVIGATGWTGIARLIRGEFLRQRNMEYVTAAEALGVPAPRIIFRHILPNAIAPVLVAITFGIAGAILTEAGLSFLGFGVAPPTPTWGELLNQGKNAPLVNWWIVIFPGCILFTAIFAYNLLGEALRDALDPRLRR